uniref:Uncharacterized protein n=1 Tax=Knipowitschia caucasica TaxID=637954 RepID=A0AAV2JWQ6_KNICA
MEQETADSIVAALKLAIEEQGSTIGKSIDELKRSVDFLSAEVKVQHHNDTAAVDTEVHLLKESFDLLQTLKTDDNGLASFKLNTSLFQGSFTVKASVYKMYTHTLMRPHFALASLHLTEIQQTSLHTRTSSSLEVQAEDRPLVCGAQETLNLSYSIVGEGQGQLHIIYLLLSRGNIVKYGQYSNYMDTSQDLSVAVGSDSSQSAEPKRHHQDSSQSEEPKRHHQDSSQSEEPKHHHQDSSQSEEPVYEQGDC